MHVFEKAKGGLGDKASHGDLGLPICLWQLVTEGQGFITFSGLGLQVGSEALTRVLTLLYQALPWRSPAFLLCLCNRLSPILSTSVSPLAKEIPS